MVEFDGRQVEIFTDFQRDNTGYHCHNLDHATGRCGVHVAVGGGGQPFSCDFELIRFFTGDHVSRLRQSLFGRGWNMLRVDGARGALCSLTPEDVVSRADAVRKLKRLREWCTWFGMEDHRLDALIAWTEHGRADEVLDFPAGSAEPSVDRYTGAVSRALEQVAGRRSMSIIDRINSLKPRGTV